MVRIIKRIIIFIVCALLVILVVGSILGVSMIVSDIQRCKELYSITSVDELHKLTSAFDEIEIISCDCVWKAEVTFMGDVLESQISGKIVLQEDYFNNITTTHAWEKFEDKNETNYSNIEGTEILCEFLNKRSYYVSETYQSTLKPIVYLSKEEQALYFYYYIY